jgi:hypothetical protein
VKSSHHHQDPIECHLYVLGARTDWVFKAVEEDKDCAAFSMRGDTHAFFLVRIVGRMSVVDIINHEVLHIVFNRLGEIRASNMFDRVSNHDGTYGLLLGGL